MRTGSLAASLLVMSTAALASGVLFTFPNFTSTAGLTLVGNATTTTTSDGTVLRVVSAAGSESGAVYYTTPITLGSGNTFSTQFQFRFTNPGGVDPADGITFVLAASPSGLGGTGNGIGYVGVSNSVAVEFGTYNNAIGDGPYAGAPNSSNHVAIDTNGVRTQTDVTNVYGNSSCGFSTGYPVQNSYTAAGCMSNGDLWTVTITYDGTGLTVTLLDPSEGTTFTALNYVPINIASYLGSSNAYVGITGGTGAGWENEDIVNWTFSNAAQITSPVSPTPAPTSFILMLTGLSMVGLFFGVLRWRSSALPKPPLP